MIDVAVRSHHDKRFVGDFSDRAFDVAYAHTAVDKKRRFIAQKQIAICKPEVVQNVGVRRKSFGGIIGSHSSFHSISPFLFVSFYHIKSALSKNKRA